MLPKLAGELVLLNAVFRVNMCRLCIVPGESASLNRMGLTSELTGTGLHCPYTFIFNWDIFKFHFSIFIRLFSMLATHSNSLGFDHLYFYIKYDQIQSREEHWMLIEGEELLCGRWQQSIA